MLSATSVLEYSSATAPGGKGGEKRREGKKSRGWAGEWGGVGMDLGRGPGL